MSRHRSRLRVSCHYLVIVVVVIYLVFPVICGFVIYG
jgi:hypothetical protein